MLGGSTGELALIFFLALLVFGPERLPRLARNAGKFLRRSRMLAQSVWKQLEEEIDRDEQQHARQAAADRLSSSLQPGEPGPAEPDRSKTPVLKEP